MLKNGERLVNNLVINIYINKTNSLKNYQETLPIVTKTCFTNNCLIYNNYFLNNKLNTFPVTVKISFLDNIIKWNSSSERLCQAINSYAL
jgi:hypothetical protein